MKHILLLLITITALNAAAQKAVWQKRADSLLKELPLAKHDTDRMHIFDGLVNSYGFSYNDEESRRYAQMMLSLADSMYDRSWQADANFHLGHIDHNSEDRKSALEHYARSLQLWREVDNKKHIGEVLAARGMVYADMKRYNKALDTLLESNIILEFADRDALGYTYSAVGYVNLRVYRYHEAERAFKQAIPLYKKADNKHGMTWVYANLGLIYHRQKRYTEALQMDEDALKLAKEIDNTALAALVEKNRALTKKKGRI